NKYQDTPLHDAVGEGKTEVAELLIRKGADVNAKNAGQETPLHDAAVQGNTEVVALLIRKGADVNARNDVQATPLHEAAMYGKTKVAELLILNGADVNARNKYQETPLHRAVGNTKVAELLISKGADINARDEDQGTPRHDAASRGQTKVAELLIRKGADVNAKNASGATASLITERDLHMAHAQIDEHIKKANQYLDNKDRARAIEEMREAVQLEPDDGRSHSWLGYVLSYGDNPHAKEAITELKYAERLGIRSVDLYWALGVSYENLDGYDAAIENYNKALALVISDDVQKAKLHNNIGNVYEKKGDSEKSLEHFEQALKLGYSGNNHIKAEIWKHKRLLGR
ncbi:MAG: ankyrin repeat domain-containing protein, partial [Mariprofundaceae bacterium]|nr:ankyrin repeat domain-containing protein [Mariprofundaceae bacterium]